MNSYDAVLEWPAVVQILQALSDQRQTAKVDWESPGHFNVAIAVNGGGRVVVYPAEGSWPDAAPVTGWCSWYYGPEDDSTEDCSVHQEPEGGTGDPAAVALAVARFVGTWNGKHPDPHLPHFEHLVLLRAADLLTARGHDARAELMPYDQAATGPLTVGAAIEMAAAQMPDRPEPGQAQPCSQVYCPWHMSGEVLLVSYLYATILEPKWTAATIACEVCTVCPKHADDVLEMFNNANHCGCEPCDDHDYMHPLHMAGDYGPEEWIEDWERQTGGPSEVIAALRAAAALR